MFVLTSNLKCCIPAIDFSGRILGHTPIDATILFFFPVHRTQEEQRSRRQQYSMRLIVVGAGSNRLTILEPFNGRFRFAFGLTIERDRFVLGHYNVAGMFRYSWRPILSCANEQRDIKIRFIITVETYCVLMIYFEKKK